MQQRCRAFAAYLTLDESFDQLTRQVDRFDFVLQACADENLSLVDLVSWFSGLSTDPEAPPSLASLSASAVYDHLSDAALLSPRLLAKFKEAELSPAPQFCAIFKCQGVPWDPWSLSSSRLV